MMSLLSCLHHMGRTSFISRMRAHPLTTPSGHFRSLVYHPSHHHVRQKRCIHLQPAIETAIQGTQDIILGLHTVTHTPWCLTIPLVAAGVGLLFRFPLNAYIQRIHQRRTRLVPLMQAWASRIAREISKEGSVLSATMPEFERRQQKLHNELYAKFGVPWWKTYCNLLSFPFWLLAIDAIRRLCGGPSGLLGSLFLGTGADRTAISTGTDGLPIAEATRYMAEPSLALEGCLWFSDLTIPDPYHILPYLLSVTLAANVLPKTGAQLRALFGLKPRQEEYQVAKPGSTNQMRLQRFLFFVALSVGPITQGLPAALHLYWLSSSATHWATQRLLNYTMPVRNSLQHRCAGSEMPVIRPQRKLEHMSAENVREVSSAGHTRPPREREG
ncbi:hypothetical protein F5Y15DRAFT_160645 [Xylariaceae sp. FL0016]|nr:hypothetical protein F5Y15DRAFT_160645 [Xylariaceae sp. FL0016]